MISRSKISLHKADHRALIHICRGKIQKTTSQLDLTLASVVSNNRKEFFKYVSSRSRPQKTLELYLMKTVTCQIGIQKKWTYLILFFPSIFNNTDTHWAAWFPETGDQNCWNSDFLLVDTIAK